MGATSSNFVSSTAEVQTTLNNSTNATTLTSNDAEQTFDSTGDITIQNCSDVNLGSVASQSNQSTQYGTVASEDQALTDIATDLLQSSTADVSGYGIGAASSSNTAAMLSTVSTVVNNDTNESMSSTNSAIQSFISGGNITIDCGTNDWGGAAGGSITIGNVVSQTNTTDQTIDASNATEVDNTISQTVDQSASSTVSGINFSIFAIIGGIILLIVVMVIISKMAKQNNNAILQALNGSQQVLGKLTKTGLCLIAIAVLLLTSGIISIFTRVPCSMNEHCASLDWFNSGKCSCTDHFKCASAGLNKTQLSNVAAPLLFMATIDPTTDLEGSAYSTYLNRASVTAWISNLDTSAKGRNNNGYNIKIYQQMYKFAVGGDSGSGASFALPLLKYMRQKIKTNDDDGNLELDSSTGSTSYKAVQYMSIPGGSNASVRPCVAEMAGAVLPMEPYYLPEKYADVNQSSSSSSSTTSFLQKGTITKMQQRMQQRMKLNKRKPKRQMKHKNKFRSKVVICKHCGKTKDQHKLVFVRKKLKPQDLKKKKFIKMTAVAGAGNLVGNFCYNDVDPENIIFARRVNDDPCSETYGSSDWKPMFRSSRAQAIYSTVADWLPSQAVFGSSDTDAYKCNTLTNSYPDDSNANKLFDTNCGSNKFGNTPKITNCANALPNNKTNNSVGVVFGVRNTNSKLQYTPSCHPINNSEHRPFVFVMPDGVLTTQKYDYDYSEELKLTGGDKEYSTHDEISVSTSNNVNYGNALCREGLGFQDANKSVFDDVAKGPIMTGIAANATEYLAGQDGISGELYYQPVVACTVEYDDSAGTDNNIDTPYVCSSSTPQYCWTPALCAAHGRVWSKPGCENDDDVDCYEGGAYCGTAATVCQPGNCSVCDSNTCNDIEGCEWNTSTGKCKTKCSSSNNICCSCSSEECGADGNTCVQTVSGRCALGRDPCVNTTDDDSMENDDGLQGISDSSNTPDCPSLQTTHYLVEIPETFRKQTTTSTNCLPQVFVPTPNSTTFYYGQSVDNASSYYKDCSSASTGSDGTSTSSFAASNISNYTANCNYPVDNGYGATGCYQDQATYNTNSNYTTESTYKWKTLEINNSARCHDFSEDGDDIYAANYCAIPTNEFSCWKDAQADDNSLAMYYMFVRMFQWLCFYGNSTSNTEAKLSQLGASVLMNPLGMDSESGEPNYPLETLEDMEAMIGVNGNYWARVQPLLIKTDSGDYEWITLEDMYYKYRTQYLGQITNFVYDPNDTTTSLTNDMIGMARDGLVSSDYNPSNLGDCMSLIEADSGTMIGSYGYCLNLFNNPIFTGITIGLAILIIIVVLLLTFLT